MMTFSCIFLSQTTWRQRHKQLRSLFVPSEDRWSPQLSRLHFCIKRARALQVKDYTEKTTELTENIRQQFLSQSRELNLKEYYSKPGHTHPQSYVAPDEIAKGIIEEIKNRISGTENWWGGEPTIEPFTSKKKSF